MIREAAIADLEPMQRVELAAGNSFRGIGMVEIADEPPASITDLIELLRSGMGWVDYARLGFAIVPEAAWTPGVRRRAAEEAANGLDAWPRVVMSRRRRS